MSSHRPLRIACLHGFRHNAQFCRHQTRGLRKSLERDLHLILSDSANASSPTRPAHAEPLPLAELVYIDAPFVIEKVLSDDSDGNSPVAERTVYSPKIITKASAADATGRSNKVRDLTHRTWWTLEGRVYTGWQQSKEYLRTKFAEKQFDGILGYSQGAIVVSLICALQNDSTSRLEEFSSLRFAIMMSGFPSRADKHQHFYAEPINLPSMHIWGLKDDIVPPFASKKLMDTFRVEDRRYVEHANGHMVPSDSNTRNAISDFVLQLASDAVDSAVDGPRAAL